MIRTRQASGRAAHRALSALVLLVAAGTVLAACGSSTTARTGHDAGSAASDGIDAVSAHTSYPSSPPAHVKPVRTTMKQFTPLDAHGHRTVAATSGGSGKCFATSIAVPLSGVYRCLSGNNILDPCFAPAHVTTPARVVCFADPWSAGTVLTVHGALPHYTPDPTPGDPWAIALSNGARCVAVTGAVPQLNGIDLTYGCGEGTVAGLTSTTNGALVAHYGPSTGPLHDVGVRTAWRGHSYRLAH
jgi:hypothetical protein